MKVSSARGGLLGLGCLAALGLMLLGAGLCWAGPGGSVGYWGGLGGSDVGGGVSGDLLKESNDYDIAVDDLGNPHVVWASPTVFEPTATPTSIICYSFYDGNRWRGLPDAEDHTEFGMGQNCKVTILPGGWPVVVYTALDPARWEVSLRALFFNGFEWITFMSPDLNRIPAATFKVVVDGLSRLHFVYTICVQNPDGKVSRYLHYCFFDGQTLQGLGGSDEARAWPVMFS